MPERKTDREILLEIHDVLFDRDGRTGLCHQVEQNTKAIVKLWVSIAVLSASVGGGVYGVIELLAK